MKLRKSRAFRRGRIEIIPMIDVMFFLLVTFMLASLSMQRLDALPVNLPQGTTAPLPAGSPVTLNVSRGGQVDIDHTPVTLDTLAAVLKTKLKGPDTNIVVAADNQAPQGVVVQAMLRARQAGASNFLIAVRPE